MGCQRVWRRPSSPRTILESPLPLEEQLVCEYELATWLKSNPLEEWLDQHMAEGQHDEHELESELAPKRQRAE